MLRFIHNKAIGKFLAVILGLITAAYFAWGFFFFGEWLGNSFLDNLPGGPVVLGALCAGLMCLAVLYSFFYWEYASEDVQAYEDDRGDGSFESALHQLKWAVRALEVFSLTFRWWYLTWSFAGLILVLIGLGLLWFSHILGKVLHAQANRPHDVEASRVMNDAGSRVWIGLSKHLKRMDVDQLRRIASGDPSPLDEVKDASRTEREREITRAEQRRRENQARRDQAQTFVTRFLTPRSSVKETRVLEEPGPTPFRQNRQT